VASVPPSSPGAGRWVKVTDPPLRLVAYPGAVATDVVGESRRPAPMTRMTPFLAEHLDGQEAVLPTLVGTQRGPWL